MSQERKNKEIQKEAGKGPPNQKKYNETQIQTHASSTGCR